MFISAAIEKEIPTYGDLIRNMAAIAIFISIIYLSNGNNLLPNHPNRYLYPYTS